jgi:hypothetical protein
LKHIKNGGFDSCFFRGDKSMGVKMERAYSEKLKRPVSITEVNKRNRDALCLRCLDENCSAAVTLTEEHNRTYGDVKVFIPSYFRLVSERKSPHSADCSYSTLGEVHNIAKESKGILKSLNDKSFEFRLQVLTNLGSKQNGKLTSDSKKSKSDKIPKNNKVLSVGTKNAYLSTVKKILELKSRIEEEQQLSTIITLKEGSQSIKWKDFYFEKDEYYNLFKLLENKVEYPVCLEGIVKRIDFNIENGTKKGNIELYRLSTQNINGEVLIPSVFIKFLGSNIYDEIKRLSKKKSINNLAVYCDEINFNKNGKYLNINLNIYNKKQIHIW